MSEYVNMTVQVPIEIAQAAKNGQAEIMGLTEDAKDADGVLCKEIKFRLEKVGF